MTQSICSTSEPSVKSTVTIRTERLVLDHPWKQSRLYTGWQALFADDPQSHCAQLPDFVAADYALQSVPTHLAPFAVTACVDDELVALAALLPKVISTKKLTGIKIGWNLHGYRLAANRCLSLDENVEESTALLHGAMRYIQSQKAAFLTIEDLDDQSGLFAAVQACEKFGYSRFDSHSFQPRFRIRFPSTAEEYWSRFSGKTRYNFRRTLKLAGENRLVRVTDPADVIGFLKQANRISQQTWQTRQFGLRVTNSERERQLFSILAENGLLRSYLWVIGETPVAFVIGNQCAGCFQYEEVGYLPEYAKFSPGQMLLVKVIEDLYSDNPPNVFDFGGGEADYKRMFADDVSRSGTIWLVPPGLKMRATLGYLQGCASLQQTARRLVKSIGLKDRFRRWTRRKVDSTEGAEKLPGNKVS